MIIRYCNGCRWLLRAAYYAQELLTTFDSRVAGVTLEPDHSVPGGVFTVHVDGRAVWSRIDDGGFPEIKELKRRVRDRLAPNLDLGHYDRPAQPYATGAQACPLDDASDATNP